MTEISDSRSCILQPSNFVRPGQVLVYFFEFSRQSDELPGHLTITSYLPGRKTFLILKLSLFSRIMRTRKTTFKAFVIMKNEHGLKSVLFQF